MKKITLVIIQTFTVPLNACVRHKTVKLPLATTTLNFDQNHSRFNVKIAHALKRFPMKKFTPKSMNFTPTKCHELDTTLDVYDAAFLECFERKTTTKLNKLQVAHKGATLCPCSHCGVRLSIRFDFDGSLVFPAVFNFQAEDSFTINTITAFIRLIYFSNEIDWWNKRKLLIVIKSLKRIWKNARHPKYIENGFNHWQIHAPIRTIVPIL